MFNISDTGKSIIKIIAALALIALGVGVFVTQVWFKETTPFVYAKGLLFGTIIAVMKLILLDRTLSKSVNMPPARAQNYVRLHYTLRYFLTAVVLVVAALNSSVNLVGVIIGLVLLRPAIYIVNMSQNKRDNL